MRTGLKMDWAGLERVVSGGQVGVDQGGLEAARDYCVSTGGWAPKGYRTTTGSNLQLKEWYGLKEHVSKEYPPRTEQNVIDSDGTLIIGTNLKSTGTALTVRLCKRHKKPVYTVQIPTPAEFWDRERQCVDIAEWLELNCIRVLNVAGNHHQWVKHRLITKDLLTRVFDILIFDNLLTVV